MARHRSQSPKNKAGLVARQIAVQWLVECLHKSKSTDQLFIDVESDPQWQVLDPRDKAFARSILMTTLRYKGDLSWVLEQFLAKIPPPKTRVMEILLIAAAQLLKMAVPAHAVIDMAVSQAKLSDKSQHLSKLVNAVLRRLTDQGPELLATKPDVSRNFPSLFMEKWRTHYGNETAIKIASALLQPAALDLFVKDQPVSIREELAKSLEAIPIGKQGLRLLHRGAIPELAQFELGNWWVQDFSAFLPTTLFGDLKEKRVLDLCAAPGGKTAGLIIGGAEVTALDVSAKRLQRLHENLERLQLKAKVINKDIHAYKPSEPFDAVLLDAPCSATGTIRRHPDILHTKTERNLAELQRLQMKLLEKAATFLKPNGTLIYCTCSLEPEEGELLIDRFLQTHASFLRTPIDKSEIFNKTDWLTKQGDVRLLPYFSPPSDEPLAENMLGMDGFFISRLCLNP